MGWNLGKDDMGIGQNFGILECWRNGVLYKGKEEFLKAQTIFMGDTYIKMKSDRVLL